MAETAYRSLEDQMKSLIGDGNSPEMAIKVMKGTHPYNLALSSMSLEEIQKLVELGKDYANKS